MEKIFSDRIVCVTGAAKGIGLACAQAFARSGASVVVMGRTPADFGPIEVELGLLTQVQCVPVDLAVEAQVIRAFEDIGRRWGRIDYLVNNAAVVMPNLLESMACEAWDNVMNTNVRGPWLCAREALRWMKSGGAIVNIGSLAGIRSTTKFAGFGAYSSSKFALVGLTEVMAVEFAKKGIRVNCVAPGAVDTDMLHRVAPDLKPKARPQDIAESVMFFCDEKRSGCTTGTTLELYTNS